MGFSEKITHFSNKFSELWIVKSIRTGLVHALPLMLLGAFSLLVLNLPVPQFQNFMDSIFQEHWKSFLSQMYSGTYLAMAILVFVSITYQLCLGSKTLSKNKVPAILGTLIVFGAYVALIAHEDILLKNDLLSMNGLFNAIFFSILLTSILIFFYKHKIFKAKVYAYRADMVFEKAMQMLEPAIFTFISALIFKYIFTVLQVNTYNIADLFTLLFSKFHLDFILFYEFIGQVLWFFGIHGNNVMEGLLLPLFENSGIFIKDFFDIFVFLGGSGATICLIFALLISRIRKAPKVARYSIIPAIFNINETVMFGLPVILEPFFLIPFMLVPVILTAITFVAFQNGYVPPIINHDVMWTTPIFLGGYLATGSIAGAILQGVNIFVGTSIYFPFVMLYNKYQKSKSKGVFQKHIDELMELPASEILTNQGELGLLANILTNDMLDNFKGNKSEFSMEYQPQVEVTKKERVYGIEALLRYKHKEYGFIPPPIIVKLLKEERYEVQLGYWIIETCIKTQAMLNKKGIKVLLSQNLSNSQMEDKKLITFIKNTIKKYNINPKTLKFELLEDAEVLDTEENKNVINELQALGCKIAVDDFGMGHSTLMYIKKFNIDTIKLDGVLTKDIVTNAESVSIIKSVCDLATDLDLSIIAEYVETKEQRDILLNLGCNIFQGYYYSKSLSFEELIAYINKMKK